MKRLTKITRYILICLIALTVGLIVTKMVTEEADAQIDEIDAFIAEHETEPHGHLKEMETVSLSYEDWKAERETHVDNHSVAESCNYNTSDTVVYSDEQVPLSIWELGLQHGISELDTTRTLKLITYEGYGESPLSYYVACCCFVRATEGYWGYSNLFEAFGEADSVSNGGQYGEWMDELPIEDYAFDALTKCYLNPSYVKYCNGMTIPEEWIYTDGFIYVW